MKVSAVVMLLFLFPAMASSQVRIRIFAGQQPQTAIFSVTEGQYELNAHPGTGWVLKPGDLDVPVFDTLTLLARGAIAAAGRKPL